MFFALGYEDKSDGLTGSNFSDTFGLAASHAYVSSEAFGAASPT
jgi:hypothetical protein